MYAPGMDTTEQVEAALVKLQRKALLKPGEVAALMRVDPKTVTRWASAKPGKPPKLRSIRTLGGHRRFLAKDVAKMLEVDEDPQP